MKKNIQFILIFIAVSLEIVSCYVYVVPQQACITLMPGHNVSAQTSISPYQILLDKKYFNSYERITVTLAGNIQFSGFILQARLVNTNHIVGYWDYDAKLNPNIGVLKCYETNNSLTHAWPQFSNPKNDFFNNITAFWVAPLSNNWDIQFVATVVYNKNLFWKDIKSELLIPNNRKNNGIKVFGNYLMTLTNILFIKVLIF